MYIKSGTITSRKWLVNRKGKRVTKKYVDITEQSIGPFILFVAKSAKRIKLGRVILNQSGSIILEHKGNVEAIKLTNDLFAFKYDGKYHIYNAKGEMLRDDITAVWNCKQYSMLNVEIDNKIYYMDYNLNILSVPFAETTSFDKYGYAIVKLWETQKLAVINKDLKFVLAPVEYDGILFCSENYFRVIKGRRYGVVDITGKEIIPPIYDDVMYVKGYFKLCFDGKYGLADSNGNIIYECIYKDIITKKDNAS